MKILEYELLTIVEYEYDATLGEAKVDYANDAAKFNYSFINAQAPIASIPAVSARRTDAPSETH